MEEHLNVVLFFQYYKLYIFLYMCSYGQIRGSLIRPELRKETTKQNHKRVMQSRSRIQTTGPNNRYQLRDYSKSSNRSDNP